jgi:hypothetical protein
MQIFADSKTYSYHTAVFANELNDLVIEAKPYLFRKRRITSR